MAKLTASQNPLDLFWNLLYQELGENFPSDRTLKAQAARMRAAFTEGRAQLKAGYMSDPLTAKAYLAAFAPLNFNKVLALLRAHKVPLGNRWCDLGCGPGTAVLAALAWFKESGAESITHFQKPLEITLVDRDRRVVEGAKNRVEKYAALLGLTPPKVTVLASWPETLNRDMIFDTSFATNILNEIPDAKPLEKLWYHTKDVFFALEPSHRVSSQKLVRLRERLKTDAQILGPCLHAEECPVNRTKHWCHFSEPLTDKRLLDLNIKQFSDERKWMKFSYFILQRKSDALVVPKRDTHTYRAIGDLHQSGPEHLAIDLCEPKRKKSLRLPKRLPTGLLSTLVRGALVTLTGPEGREQVKSAKPLSPGARTTELRTRRRT